MFSLLFSKENTGRVFYLKVCGIRSGSGTIVWGAPIEYKPAKRFVDSLNERVLPEEELLDVVLDFLVENMDELCLPAN